MAIPAGLILLGWAATSVAAQPLPQETGLTREIRGLHAASAAVVWAGAREGWYTRTTDGGATWRADTVPGAGRLFFVDVHAAGPREAWLLGQSFDGGLARIYHTADGGDRWTLQYENSHPDVFLDGLAFWDARRGVAFGDPVEGAFTVLRTSDGGRTWNHVPAASLPPPLEGEAGFAASGTAVAVGPGGRAWIATGGAGHARVLYTADGGVTWDAADTPLGAGGTAGLFGIAFRDSLHGVAVGGNYTRPEAPDTTVIVTADGGRTWQLAGRGAPDGVRWGVAWAPDWGAWVAAGPSGVGVSPDGRAWTALASPGANTVAAAGGRVWIAGRDGWLARLPRP